MRTNCVLGIRVREEKFQGNSHPNLENIIVTHQRKLYKNEIATIFKESKKRPIHKGTV